jgi:hypothetical protein
MKILRYVAALWFLGLTVSALAQPLGPLHASAITGPAQECVAEVNAATAIDVACSIPSDAKYDFKLYAKNGVDASGGFNWVTCSTASPYLCPGVSGSWANGGELPEESGRMAIQFRIVPFSKKKAETMKIKLVPVRARLVVTYQSRSK